MKKKERFIILLAGLLVGAASCQPLVEDSSASALKSGESTMLLGGCQNGLAKGYTSCQFVEGGSLPRLRLVFMNPGEYLVSDCRSNTFTQGSVDRPQEVEIDITALGPDIEKLRACILRVDAVEYYPDPRDKNIRRPIAMAGGFFIESLSRGYIPTPAEDLVGWCYTVKRTTAGRTTVTRCK